LCAAHQQLNRDRFAGVLGEIAIRVSRRMRSRLGHYSPGGATAPEIAIARRHLRRDGWTSVLDTLTHEMVHQWQHETARPLAHDRDFRHKAREVGIAPHAKRPVGG
jgi:predicted SprT family Zn-dependent metalloprotease